MFEKNVIYNMDKLCVLLLLLILQIGSEANFTECILDCNDVITCERSCPKGLLLHTSQSAVNATSCGNLTFIDGNITTTANLNTFLPTESHTDSSVSTSIINSKSSTTSLPPINFTDNQNKVQFICVMSCPDGYYMNENNRSCVSCREFCENCNNIQQIVLNGCICNITERSCSTDPDKTSFDDTVYQILLIVSLTIFILLAICMIKYFCNRKKQRNAFSSPESSIIRIQAPNKKSYAPKKNTHTQKEINYRCGFSRYSIDELENRPVVLYSQSNAAFEPEVAHPPPYESLDDNHDAEQQEISMDEQRERQYKCIADTPVFSSKIEIVSETYQSHSSYGDIRLLTIEGKSGMQSTTNKSAYDNHSSKIYEQIDQSITVTQYEYLENLDTVDFFCDNVHLLCFIDKRLYKTEKCLFVRTTTDQTSMINDNAWYSSDKTQPKTTMETSYNPERSSTVDLFFFWDEETDAIELLSEYFIMTLFLKNTHQVDFEESFLVAAEKEFCCLCRWLLANYTYDGEFLEKMLYKAYEIGNYDIIKSLAWTVTRIFFKKYKNILIQDTKDIYPAYRCKCHRSVDDQECLIMSKKLIVIERTKNYVIDIPDKYMNFEVLCFSCDDEEGSTNIQHETGEIMKAVREKYGTNSYNLMMPKIDGETSSLLFSQHNKLSLICPSQMKSSNYGINHKIIATQCIQLYCERKGIIPLGEKHFPTNIKGIPTDVLQGRGQFAATTLRVGDKIGTANTWGTLGGFYLYAGNFECLLTCAHVLYSLPTLLAPPDHMCHEHRVDVFLDPAQTKQQCGVVIRRIFKHDDSTATSIDAALVYIESASFTIDPNDIVLDINGPYTTNFLGLSSPFVNHNYCDHLILCCTGSSVSTVAVGALTKNIQNVTFHRQTQKDVHFEDLGPVSGHANGVNFPSFFIAQPAHMQIPVGSLTEKRIFTMYNQIVMNIPLRQGDSGTCIYITGNTTQNTGCVGMAIAFCSGSGLSLVTPIQEIVRAVNGL